MAPADEIGVLALPADPRRLAQRLFHDRRSVDEDLDLGPRHFSHDPACQRLQCALHHIVIIGALRIDRYARAVLRFGERHGIGGGRIAHAERDHALRGGPE